MKHLAMISTCLCFQNEKELFLRIGPMSNITFAFPVVRSLLLKDMDSLLRNITYLPILETPGKGTAQLQKHQVGRSLASCSRDTK